MRISLTPLFLAFLILFTSGCQNVQEPNEQSEDNISPEVTQENTNKEIRYQVSNDGGSFSNKDLIYFILTDRFYDGDSTNNDFSDMNKDDPRSYHGGDLNGVIAKLDYIKSLGATAIWITPVAENESNGYHGYWINDFYKVDSHFGTMDDLKTLVNEAHRRDIKVILDHVVNHTGYKSPWLNDKDHKNWFHPRLEITNWSDQEQIENGWLAGLPDLDQDNPEVREFLLENSLWWIRETGVDGMRLDTMRHVSKDFWNEFAYTIKKEFPDFYLLGEVWNNNVVYLESYHQLGIDGLTNYPLFEGIRSTFTRFGKTSGLVRALKEQSQFTSPEINGIFIDNHDDRRLISAAKDSGPEYLKQALTFVMTYPAIPIIYYGTEIGMEGEDDPDNRRDMDWNKAQSSEILEFYRGLVDLRKNNPAIANGEFKLLDYDNYFLSYMRKTHDSSVIIVMNVERKEKTVTVSVDDSSTDYIDRISGKNYEVIDNKLNIELKPLDLIILESR